MRELLIENSILFAAVIAFCECILALLLAADFLKTRRPVSLLMAVTSLALTFDAAVLAFGSALSGDLLRILSRIRFVSHGAVIPLILMICAYALHPDLPLLRVMWVITIALCAAGAFSGFSQVLEQREFAGIVRYASSSETPLWAAKFNRILSFGAVIPLIAAGILVIIREKNPCLMLAGLLMFVFAALGPATGNTDLIFLISMAGELLMALCYLIYALTTHEDELL